MSRTVVVQGASRGLGRAFVDLCLARGDRVVATCRDPGRTELPAHPNLSVHALDVTDEATVAAAAAAVRNEVARVDLLLNVAGILAAPGRSPEKRLEHVDPAHLHAVFAVNAVGPLLVTRHFLPLLKHDRPAVVANLSARVGSIGDNHLGGWYGYRASKAAQNQLSKTLAVELSRRAKNVCVVALHPGTVDTDLSRPFHRNVPAHKLFGRERAARQLLAVIDGLTTADSGAFLAWDGSPIPW
ncbi:MAG: NAD(P)-dependent dehydrogenase (short-subunit alcohol dehydrogenase family) [Myxococcota bacterium]|jgi:NAD(P)-dependent dehydrogenase (short-subunit alcohol dehydrogenase family)